MNQLPKIYIFTGERDSGKTTFLKNIIEQLIEKGITMDGFYAEKKFRDNVFSVYNLVHILDGTKQEFLILKSDLSDPNSTRFDINSNALGIGYQWLNEISTSVELIIIDEVGKWELQGKGWSKAIENTIKHSNQPILLVVREKFLTDIISHFNIENYSIFNSENFTSSNFHKDFL
jgi:nucleoside-triphosphatase THEP1